MIWNVKQLQVVVTRSRIRLWEQVAEVEQRKSQQNMCMSRNQEARMFSGTSMWMFKSLMRMAEPGIKRKTVSKGSNSINESKFRDFIVFDQHSQTVFNLEIASTHQMSSQKMACINENDSQLRREMQLLHGLFKPARAAHSSPVGNLCGNAHYDQKLFSEHGMRTSVVMVERGGGTVVKFKHLIISSYNDLIFRPLNQGHLLQGLGRAVVGYSFHHPLHILSEYCYFFSDVSFFLGSHADYLTFMSPFFSL